VGIVPTEEAIRLAYEVELDLVEVAPNERPPVCRMMDYGKWRYQQKKKQKGKPQHETQLKELRLRPKIDKHDLDTKMGRARQFLSRGDRVQFTMLFRGRERFHPDIGIEMFRELLAQLGDQIKVERQPTFEGRRLIMMVAPAKH
jgi:translation initiation factor IF-3